MLNNKLNNKLNINNMLNIMKLAITEKKPSICLNMIVKNESHIIEKTLLNLCDKINFSYWIICDTGSTDNTPELITTFFKNKNIPGQLFYDKWQDFAHNRTIALEKAFNKTDLLLVFDADDELCGEIIMPSTPNYDEYHMKFGTSSGTNYTRVLLINNRKRFQYLSVIHEFIICKEQGSTSTVIDGNYYVISGRSGNRSKDPDKYLKDAIILEKAYKEAFEKDDALYLRYAFYCANSYKDYGQFEDAIKWYKIVLGHENQWAQEKYMACLNIYNCYASLKQPENGFYYLVKGLNYDKERVECLYPLLVHYCCDNMNNIAYNYYLTIKDTYEQTVLTVNMDNKLFTSLDKNYFFLPYYMILIADKVQQFECVVKMFEIIFIKKYKMFEEWYVKNLLYNLQFFIKHVKEENKSKFIELANAYIAFIQYNGINTYKFDFLTTDVYILSGIIVDNVCFTTNFTDLECINSKNILFYTGFSDIHWNYSYMLNNALGGSEKAVAYLTKCFPKEYTIFVGGAVSNEQVDNVTYVSLNELPKLVKTMPFHTIVVSRYISFYEMFKECSFYQSYIWAHDTLLLPYGCNLTDNQILTKWNKSITGCICLTDWHRNLFIEKYPTLQHKIQLINNGIDIANFNTNNMKIKNRFIYSSRPDRGLNVLLDLWSKIIEKMPDATLIISSYGKFPCNEEDNKLKVIIDNYDSIRHLGNLNSVKLYAEMSLAEFWLYPTTWPETSCITALEMLMSEVICIYYPVAGLVNTMQDNGIQIKKGNEIDTIINLTDDVKKKLRENGKRYAETCSWKNRSIEWTNIIFKPSTIVTKKIAIFNSFSFHYEMFGFIIHLCHKLKYQLTIFTNTDNDLGWLHYYNTHFKDYNIEYMNYTHFNARRKEFDIIFITTDDDLNFNKEWINDKCIVIDHSYVVRMPEYKYHLSTRPFIENYREWAIPCYAALQIDDKQNISTDYISIAIIGTHCDYNYKTINRLQSDSKIQLHILARKAHMFNITNITNITENIEVFIHTSIDAIELINNLKSYDYILTDCTFNIDHITGKSMSGCIPLSFSTLTPLIISNVNNALYNFKNVVTFDINGSDKININKGGINLLELALEREQLILMFDAYLIKHNFIVEITPEITPEITAEITAEITPEKNTALIIEPRNKVNS